MLKTMGKPALVVVIILFILSIYSFGVMIDRALMYSAARKQSRVLRPAGCRRSQGTASLTKPLPLPRRNKKSHIAKVVATGLSEFQSASQQVSDSDVIDAAKRGLERSVAIVHAEMKRGLSALATIGSTAPFVGLFGTVIGILNAFKGIASSHATGLSAVAGGIAASARHHCLRLARGWFPPSGLTTISPTKWKPLTSRWDNSSMELINYFILRRGAKK